MSDFDTVLERLLAEPDFRAALARDPRGALAGYHLSPDETDLLRSQISDEAGAGGRVEDRVSKASLFGLLSPLTDMGGGSGGTVSGPEGGGHVATGFDEVTRSGMGGVAQHHAAELGAGVGGAQTGFGATDPIATGYHTHIDVNGDGRWDAYTARHSRDGGVDVYVDLNGDGSADFIGHDGNGDGIIDSADYDKNFDGTFETHMRDLNGDGWMDTTTVDAPAPVAWQPVPIDGGGAEL